MSRPFWTVNKTDGPLDSLAVIEETAVDLMALRETVQRIDRAISSAESAGEPLVLNERIEQLINMFRDRHPDATFTTSLPEEAPAVAVGGLTTALEEAIENAVEHNRSRNPTVDVRVRADDEGWVEIEIEDDGPGIPAREVEVLEFGETPLHHAERLGLWQIHWIVTKAGGEFSVAPADAGGTVVTLSLPAED
jgi:signal transduction histidine kinase